MHSLPFYGHTFRTDPYAVLIFLPEAVASCPKLYTALPKKIIVVNPAQINTASSSPTPNPISHPCTGPIKLKNTRGMTMGTNESANSHPPGRNSSGVVRWISGAKKLRVENTIDANGTVKMNGTSRREAGLAGKEGVRDVGRSRGRIENFVRSSERPIASGIASGNSRPREGPLGRSVRSGVRVCKTSTVSFRIRG